MDLEVSDSRGQGDPYYVLFWKQLLSCIDSYDFILIDCPPNLYKTSECAIFSSNLIFVPCNPDALSTIGLSLLGKKVREFKQRTEDTHYSHRPGQEQANIAGIIINNKPLAHKVANIRAEPVLRAKPNAMKQDGLAAAYSKVIPVTVRHAADFRTGTLQYTPMLFARIRNRELLNDYRNLARCLAEFTMEVT